MGHDWEPGLSLYRFVPVRGLVLRLLDIAFAVSNFSRFVFNLDKPHLEADKRNKGTFRTSESRLAAIDHAVRVRVTGHGFRLSQLR